MDAQRAQICQKKHTESCNYYVYEYIMVFIKDSQRAQ